MTGVEDSEIPERCKACYAAESCGGDNPRRENGWKDCQFQLDPLQVSISINPWQFEGFWTAVGEHGRRTIARRM